MAVIAEFARYYHTSPIDVLDWPWLTFIAFLEYRNQAIERENKAAQEWQRKRK